MIRERESVLLVLGVSLIVASCGGSPVRSSDGPPLVSSIAPTAGSTLGGTQIRIIGSNFGPTSTVQFGDSPASNVVVNSSSSMTAVTGPHRAGVVDVSISSGGRSATLSGSFTYAVPSTIANAPPTIASLVAQGSRPNEPPRFADLGEDIAVNAVVEDPETSPDALTYEWTSAPGAVIVGSGRSITWRAETGSTPLTMNIMLTVAERFTTVDSAGRLVQNENRVSKEVPVNVHDSARELQDLAKDFLELFSQSNVAADVVVRNFQDGCGAGGTGKRDERMQVEENRLRFSILSWFVGTPRVTIDFGGVSPFRSRKADGWAAVDVNWRSRCLTRDDSRGCPAVGYIKNDLGTDWVTARYDEPTNRWWLCDSDYEPKNSVAAPSSSK
jgi:IPT/TIG domain-containing protein